MEARKQYPAAEVERMMKLQDVLLKAMAKKITWWDAAEIIGVSDRTMRRWRARLEEDGYSGLADRRKGRPSDKRVPLETVETVLRLYQESYFDFNIRHFHEKLRDEHSIKLSYTWVQKALQGAGLVARRSRRSKHRRRRERRPLPGMMLHIDGSKHRWFGDERWYDLIGILDDATSEIYYAQLVEEESTRTVMAGLRAVIEAKGLFCTLYSDRGSHFFVTPKAGKKVDKNRLKQVGRAMKELGVQMIPAYSPQARGRSERSFGTWQGRLPQELRLAGVSTVEEANAFLNERYIAEFTDKFTVAAKEKGTAFRKASRKDLNWVFTVQTERVVAKDNTVTIGDQSWQLEKSRFRHCLAGSKVTIHEHLNGAFQSASGLMWSAATRPPGRNNRPAKTKPGKAVEKPGPWKPWKTAKRFPPVPTVPWESPKSGITTFLPPRRRSIFTQNPGSRLRRAEGDHRVRSTDADRSCVNKSGQVDLLTTYMLSSLSIST